MSGSWSEVVPSDVLLRIAKHLRVNERARGWECVCKKFHRLSQGFGGPSDEHLVLSSSPGVLGFASRVRRDGSAWLSSLEIDCRDGFISDADCRMLASLALNRLSQLWIYGPVDPPMRSVRNLQGNHTGMSPPNNFLTSEGLVDLLSSLHGSQLISLHGILPVNDIVLSSLTNTACGALRHLRL
eukprot:scaffold385206_cov46-Prasinocladus_malaysianus.AAC.1